MSGLRFVWFLSSWLCIPDFRGSRERGRGCALVVFAFPCTELSPAFFSLKCTWLLLSPGPASFSLRGLKFWVLLLELMRQGQICCWERLRCFLPARLCLGMTTTVPFSYYRRTISRNRINNLQLDAESEVNNEMANRMSLFYAEATPMLKTLSNATTKFVSENKTLPIEDTTDCLSTMACVCRVMLETPEYRSRFTNTETLLFCMRVMVGVIILYDHVHPVGAFAKTSKIDMKGCIKVLKDQPSTSTEGLLNALRYTTRHLNDDTTSKQIRALLQ